MISLPLLFWIFVCLFAIIGTIRGWAKELMVTCSGALAVFIISVLLPLMKVGVVGNSQLWIRLIIFGLLIFFGYQTPNLRRLSESGRFQRITLKDTLFGALIGGINGYMITASIWYYIAIAGYPFTAISQPIAGSAIAETAAKVLQSAPPVLLQGNGLYVAVGIAFVIVMVLFT